MQSHASGYSTRESTDFSSVLRLAGTSKKPTAGKRVPGAGAAQPFEEYDTYNNRNLSSVISKITDDGPADLQKNSDNKLKKPPYLRSANRPAKLQDDIYTPSSAGNGNGQLELPPAFSFDENAVKNDIQPNGDKKGNITQQLVLLAMLVVVSAMVYLIYKIDLQTDELSGALQVSESQALVSGHTQTLPPEVLPELTSLGSAITDLKQDIQDIKAGQATVRQMQLNTSNTLEPRLQQTAITDGEVSALRRDFVQLQRQVHIAEADVTISDAAIERVQTAPDSQTGNSRPIQDVAPRFIVTLASFSRNDKAEAAAEILQRSGVLPLIEEIVVNDTKVYRINVDGFASRAAANAFIAEANQKYGFEGGWIREI